MPVTLQFQYQSDPTHRPNDEMDHNEPIEVKDGHPIPDIGDTVTYESYEYDYDDKGMAKLDTGREIMVARKVRTRHFSYHEGALSYINIVVGDVPKGEMLLRLKE